jgi:alternate F1F0 ATPase F0 subunit C
MGPALGEGRAVATALSSLAQQPDASATITRTLFVGLAMIESTAIYCFVVSMILIFANPFWNHVIAQAAAGKVSHAHRLVHRRCAGAQLSHPGVVAEALSLQPILDAIDAREKRIAGTRGRRREKGRSQKERDEFQHKNEEFDQQRAALLSKATDEAKAERQRLLDEARQAADALSAKRQDALRNDAEPQNQAITRRTQQEVFAIARKALTDLATTSLEERMGEVFTRRLRELDDEAKEGLAKALKTASDPRSCAARLTCLRSNARRYKCAQRNLLG